jgi:uncharacterized membrane protein
MGVIVQHFLRCLVAGTVALLPVAGLALAVFYLEYYLAAFWLAWQDFYFPGLGLLAALILLYLIGLIVGTVVGNWAWALVDHLFARLPILGNLYQTLKQILGYGEGPGALFERVVLVPIRETNALEMGLVTNTIRAAGQPERLLVFLPACPNPLAGRLIVIETERVRPIQMRVNEAMRALVALGKAGVANLHVPVEELKQAVAEQTKDMPTAGAGKSEKAPERTGG